MESKKTESVKKSRYKLKKKISLAESESLEDYIRGLRKKLSGKGPKWFSNTGASRQLYIIHPNFFTGDGQASNFTLMSRVL